MFNYDLVCSWYNNWSTLYALWNELYITNYTVLGLSINILIINFNLINYIIWQLIKLIAHQFELRNDTPKYKMINVFNEKTIQ